MKTPFVVLALAAASQAFRVPLCSAICMTNGIAATGCSASDTACICTSEKFFPTVAECAEADCNADKSVVDTAEAFCASAGIHVEVKRWNGGGGGGGGHGFGPEPQGFHGEGHEFGAGRGRGRGGRWRGGPPPEEKWGGFQEWSKSGHGGSPPAPPRGGSSKSSPPGDHSGGGGGGGGRPDWGDHGNPPHHPSPPDHHPEPTGPWTPPSTVI